MNRENNRMKKIELSEIFSTLEKLELNPEQLLADHNLKKIQNQWPQIVGDFLGNQSTPKKLETKQLFIACKHSLLVQELEFMKSKIISEIEKRIGFGIIEKIKFTAGSISKT